MELTTPNGQVIGLSDAVFGREFNEALVHQVVTAYLSGARSGTKAQKSRSDVKGGGAKPWRQKGTGRARAGTRRSPIWRHGGVSFAARPRSYQQKVNRKQYRIAMRCIFSQLFRQDRLVVVDEFKTQQINTKTIATQLKAMSLDSVLIVTNEADESLYLSVRNIPRVGICEVASLDPVSLLRFNQVLISTDALKTVQESLA